MTPEAIRRRMAHGNIYPAERIDAALAQLLPAGQPRRAARAGAAVGRRPGRGVAARLPRRPRHRGPVGDTRAGRRRHHRRRRRRGADPPRGTHGRPGRRRADRRARRRRRRPGASTTTRRSPRSDNSSSSSAATSTRSSATTPPRRWSRSPAARRRPSWCSAPAGAAGGTSWSTDRSSARVTRLAGDIDVHVIARHRRPTRPGHVHIAAAPCRSSTGAPRSAWVLMVVGLPAAHRADASVPRLDRPVDRTPARARRRAGHRGHRRTVRRRRRRGRRLAAGQLVLRAALRHA